MAKVIYFDRRKKIDSLNAFLDQVESISDIDEYLCMIKRLHDRGKLSESDADRLTKTLLIRRALMKH